jgi:hypothetical protein
MLVSDRLYEAQLDVLVDLRPKTKLPRQSCRRSVTDLWVLRALWTRDPSISYPHHSTPLVPPGPCPSGHEPCCKSEMIIVRMRARHKRQGCGALHRVVRDAGSPHPAGPSPCPPPEGEGVWCRAAEGHRDDVSGEPVFFRLAVEAPAFGFWTPKSSRSTPVFFPAPDFGLPGARATQILHFVQDDTREARMSLRGTKQSPDNHGIASSGRTPDSQ